MSIPARTPSSPLRVLIADDEPLARHRIEQLVTELDGDAFIAHADDGAAAIVAIHEIQPDIMFLDMQMPRGSGLDVVRHVGPESLPVTVFVTAHNEFAVQAFELAAADYLMKPYSDERFEAAFRRARERVALDDLAAWREQMRLVLEAGEPGRTQYLTRIAVQGRGRLRIVPVSDIDSIVANGVYVELCVGQERHLMRASLSTLAANLDPDQFFRVHRSALVKLDQIAAVVSEGGGAYRVQLQNGTLLPVARSRREELELRLGRI